MTILAFQVFLDKGVNCAIIETGIGGLLDPTNILPHPRVAAITRLDFDHVNILGHTMKDIARHKGRIIKPSAIAITVQQEPEGISQLRVSADAADVDLRISSPLGNHHRTLMGITGDHQLENAGLAIDIADAWLRGRRVDNSASTLSQRGKLPAFVEAGLRRANWPGRSDLQIVGHVSWFIDGAHTGESIKFATRWFADALSKTSYTKTALIFNRTESNKHELLRTLHDSLGSLLHRKDGPLFDMVVFCTNAMTPQLQTTPDLISLNPVPELDTSEQKSMARTWNLLDTKAGGIRVVRSVAEATAIVSALGREGV